nr:MAG TPA: hypothetical protein [Caudoviricetes sp.]
MIVRYLIFYCFLKFFTLFSIDIIGLFEFYKNILKKVLTYCKQYDIIKVPRWKEVIKMKFRLIIEIGNWRFEFSVIKKNK